MFSPIVAWELFLKSESFLRASLFKDNDHLPHKAQVLVLFIILLFVVVRSKSFLVETKAEDDAANIQDSVKNRRMDPSKGIALCYHCRGRRTCSRNGCGRRRGR